MQGLSPAPPSQSGASPSAAVEKHHAPRHILSVSRSFACTRTLSQNSEGAAYYEHVAPHLRAIEEADDMVQVPGNVRGTTFGSPCRAHLGAR